MNGKLSRTACAGVALWTVLIGVAACTGSASEGRAAPTDDPAAATAPASEDPSAAPTEQDLAMDWTGSFNLALPNGLTVRDCKGGRTHVCVHEGSTLLGDIDLAGDYPLTPEQADLRPAQTARDWAQNFVESFRDDRSQGCPDFTFEADPLTDAVVGGRRGARSGFTLQDASGAVVERVVNHFVRRGDTMTLVNTDAYATKGGCLGPAEADPSFTPEDFERIAPYLDQLIADTPLPPRGESP